MISPIDVWKKIIKMPARQKMLVIAAAGFVFVALVLGIPNNPYSSNREFNANKKFSSENVTLADNNKSLPAGLIAGIPVETANIIKSETLTYPDRKVTLYNVSYNSTKNMDELSSIYLKYFSVNSFTADASKKNGTADILHGVNKNGDEMSVVIVPQQTGNTVLISYAVRQ
jgi:hypothetical protein